MGGTTHSEIRGEPVTDFFRLMILTKGNLHKEKPQPRSFMIGLSPMFAAELLAAALGHAQRHRLLIRWGLVSSNYMSGGLMGPILKPLILDMPSLTYKAALPDRSHLS